MAQPTQTRAVSVSVARAELARQVAGQLHAVAEFSPYRDGRMVGAAVDLMRVFTEVCDCKL
jgi:hypothetical protein